MPVAGRQLKGGGSGGGKKVVAWATLGPGEVLDRLGVSGEGLSSKEAVQRLERFGENRLPRRRAPGWPRVFVRQFRSPLIAILGFAGLFSLLVGERLDAGFIAAVLALNALIGSIQEWRAERGAQALQQLLRVEATVLRDGGAVTLDAKGLVPGDVVLLESGVSVPADLRLLACFGLEVDESLLTGESVPVAKDAEHVALQHTPVSDRIGMAHAGSLVARGRGRGVVVGTGMDTQVGLIARDLMAAETAEAPLLVRMRHFARVVGLVVLFAAALLVGVGVLVGEPVHDMVLFAVAAAVSAVPEGLPVALTIALAVATTRMSRRQVIVRRLEAVEGLGSCTLIATDKTGTLTMNALTVREVRTPDGSVWGVTGEGFRPVGDVVLGAEPVHVGHHRGLDRLVAAGVWCNEATLRRDEGGGSVLGGEWSWRGDPTDVALLVLAEKLGLDRASLAVGSELVAQVPFESERQFAAAVVASGGGRVVYVKGAPERVVPMCATAGGEDLAGGEGTAKSHEGLLGEAEVMAAAGLRVLAIAGGPGEEEALRLADPTGLDFLGFVGMIDPPRPGVPEAVEAALGAGVRVVMITGDHPTTAAAIAHAVRIPVDPNSVATGGGLMGMDEHGLRDLVDHTTVYARVAPHQKLQIVQAAQARGHFVAVTGDGVNDAPALRAGHIGVAMGMGGTDVAREASDIVLADDNFTSVVAGIEEGRVAYDNVRNVIFLLVSTGAAELVLLFLALAAGSPLPLLPAQLLWLNLVTNGIQDVALGMEPGRGGEMDRPPRPPGERIFDRLMLERTLLGAVVMGGGGFAVFTMLLSWGWEVEVARNALLLLMVLFENVHVANCRSETASAFSLSPLRNPFLLWGVVAAQLLHIAALYAPPMQRLLRTQPVTLETWLALLGVALGLLVAFELHKVVRRRWPAVNRPGSAAVPR